MHIMGMIPEFLSEGAHPPLAEREEASPVEHEAWLGFQLADLIFWSRQKRKEKRSWVFAPLLFNISMRSKKKASLVFNSSTH